MGVGRNKRGGIRIDTKKQHTAATASASSLFSDGDSPPLSGIPLF